MGLHHILNANLDPEEEMRVLVTLMGKNRTQVRRNTHILEKRGLIIRPTRRARLEHDNEIKIRAVRKIQARIEHLQRQILDRHGIRANPITETP